MKPSQAANNPERMVRITYPKMLAIAPTSLIQKVFIATTEVGSSAGMTAKRITIGNLLEIVESTCNALIPVGVEGIEADGSTAIAAGVDLATIDDRLASSIDDARSGLVVGVDEVAALVLRCIRSLYIAIAQRSLERCNRF